jgi:uncharacterized membrane protein YdjX (TVP38/TMEM64 family)
VSATETDDPAASRRQRPLELAVGLAGIVVGVAVIFAVPQLRHCVSLTLHGQFSAMRAYIKGLGFGGFMLLLGLMLGHAVVFVYPTEIITATAAYVYGFGAGFSFAVAGWLACALLSYAVGRSVGQPLLRAVLGPRFHRLERTMRGGGASLVISARLIPVVPFALLGYAAGAARISIWRFSWASVVGYLPLTIAVCYLGSRAQTLSAGDPVVWAAAVMLVGLLTLDWYARHRRKAAADHAEPGADA